MNARAETAARAWRSARPRTRAWPAAAQWLAPVLPLAAALALWVDSLGGVDLDAMTDLGLVSVLPNGYFVALGLLTGGFFAVVLGSRSGEGLPAAYAASLVAMLHATPAILYESLRYPWAWKHVGIVDYIQRNGAVDPGADFLTAYHDWPGFFSLGALATDAAGEPDALGIAAWAPPFFELLFLAVVVLLARTLSNDRRVVWTTAWLFLAANWVGQDYFAPQALAFFLYLLVVAVALRWFAVRPHVASVVSMPLVRALRRPARPRLRRRAPTGMRVGLAVFIVLASAAVVTSHQLTPLILILAAGVLVHLRFTALPGLPLLLVAMTVAWVAFMARPFLEGNLYWIVDSIGSPSGNADETLLNLDEASSGQVLISTVNRALTAAVILLAALGVFRRLRAGRVDVIALLLAGLPAVLLFATSYGGEILFRIYFFALPFLALLAAHAFFPRPRARTGPGGALLITCACGLLLAAGSVSYFGKERFHRFTDGEVSASRWLYDTAPEGSLLLSATYDYPWAWRNYERYEYFALEDATASVRRRAARSPVETLEALMHEDRRPGAYIVLTRTQEARVDMTGVMQRGSLQRMERALARDPAFIEVLRRPDASIFRLDPRSRG